MKLHERITQVVVESTLMDYGWEAAIKVPTPDGQRLFTHQTHADAWMEFYQYLGFTYDEAFDACMNREYDGEIDYEEGFLSPEKRFLSREDTMKRWRSEYASHVKSNKETWADSTDLFTAA
jgi:hypothetical protein